MEHFEVPYVITTGARNEWDVRSPKEISFIAPILGTTSKRLLFSMSKVAEGIL